MNPLGLLMKQKKVTKFDTVLERITDLHDLNYPDRVVDLKDVRVCKAGSQEHPDVALEVPGIGILNMTDWSRRQLGGMLGVQWNKWFNPDTVKPEEIQQEMQRRFSRTGQSSKLRARRFKKGDPGAKKADGFLRAVLSPTYSSIDDIRVFGRLAAKFRGRMDELSFIKNHLGTDFYNEKASHYSVVGPPVNMGDIDRGHSDPRVRGIYDMAEREGLLPDADWVYQGFHVRNSEVGYTAVTIDATTFRLVCLNGAIVTISDGRLMYRMHRGIEDEGIDVLLDSAFRKMPGVWDLNQRRMAGLKDRIIGDPKEEITKFLEKNKASKTFIEAVIKAYEEEPLMSGYGVLQALTRAAHQETDMDKRYEIEELAGKYMSQARI